MSNTRIIEIPATMQTGKGKNHAIRKLRVAAYCRVSTEEEEQQSSFETQKLYYTEKITSTPEWEIAGIYADDGISGVHTKKRDGFNQMIETQKSYIQFGCSFFVLQFYMLSVRPFLWHNKATKGAELMPEIIPIRDLKNTNAISQRCHETQEPIFVTKSGYGNMVIMSIRAPRMLSGEFLFISSRVFFLAHC